MIAAVTKRFPRPGFLGSAEPSFGIAREGWPLVLLAAALLCVCLLVGWVLAAGVALLTLAFCVCYFREPGGEFPATPSGIYAPLSGRVMSVRRVRKGPLGAPALRLRLRVSWFRGYALRAPVDGQVREPARPHARGVGWLHTVSGADVLMVPKAGYAGRGSILRMSFGQRVGQARRIGPRRALRVVDVYVPMDSEVRAAVGARTTAGRTVLASLS